MITSTYSKDGKVITEEFYKYYKRNEMWIDCKNPKKRDLKILADQTKIPLEDFIRALDEDERPHINDFDNHSIVTIKAPHKTNTSLTTVPITFILKDQSVIILRRHDFEWLANVNSLTDEQKMKLFKKDLTYTLSAFFEQVLTSFFKYTDFLEDELDKVEKHVFKSPTKKVVKEIFSLKKTLIFFHKALIGNREVLTGIEKEFLREIKGANLRRFRYLYNDVTQLIEMVGTHREVLTGTLDIYLTSVSNNMNEVMKRLTVITSFILIPTLISGIYGMNFKGMDEFNWPYGQFFAYGMMFISTLAVFFYFKKNKFM